MEQRVEIEVPLMNQIGMGSYSDRVYCDGLQAVVNLSNLELTSANHFVPHQRIHADVFTLRKDVSDFVRRLRLDTTFFMTGT